MKNKYVKIILVVLLIALILFISNIIRKIAIFSELEDKVNALNARDNIYLKSESDTEIFEQYKKDGQIKFRLTNKKTNEVKVTYGDINDYKDTIINYAEHLSLFEKIKSGITAHISTEILNGKKYYVISDMSNINWAVTQDIKNIKIYVEKETGLLIKYIATYEEREKIYTYEYLFDTVTDVDMQKEN